jgi:hypothetical protein
MAGAHTFHFHAGSITTCGRWLGVSSATALLIGLSLLNSMHGPAFDCVRAGAYLLRSRRGGPYVPLVAIEQSYERYGAALTARAPR